MSGAMQVFLLCLVVARFAQVKGDCTSAFNYCDLTHTITSHWVKGSGLPIKSWINSVVPSYENCSANVRLSTNRAGEVLQLSHLSEKITWTKYGPDPFDGYLYEDDGVKAYIYDDMTTVLMGEFRPDGFLQSGKASRITAFKCFHGIMKLKMSAKQSLETYYYDPINEFSMLKYPILMDPMEKRQLFINVSELPDLVFSEGVFAKKFIPANSLIAVYSGMLIDGDTSAFFDNMTIAEKEDVNKNWLFYNDSYSIDVPPAYTDLRHYRASLGHKINHQFEPKANGEFCFMKHPRFGHIRCVKSIRNIEAGEEIYEDYTYDLNDADIPRWYFIAYHALQKDGN